MKRLLTLSLLLALVSCGRAYQSDLKDDRLETRDLHRMVRGLFLGGKYSELDALEAGYKKDKTRTQAGQWKLFHFYETFSEAEQPMDPELYWEDTIARLADWQAAEPASRAAVLAEAGAWMGYAWRASEGGDEGSQDFQVRLEKAKVALDRAQTMGADTHPHYFYLKMWWANSAGESDRLPIIYSQSKETVPDYYYCATAMAWALQPQWAGGDSLGNFFEAEAKEDKERGGRILLTLAETLYTDSVKRSIVPYFLPLTPGKFGKLGMDCIRHLESKYPGSVVLANLAARLAYKAGWDDAFDERAAAIQDREDPHVWKHYGGTSEFQIGKTNAQIRRPKKGKK